MLADAGRSGIRITEVEIGAPPSPSELSAGPPLQIHLRCPQNHLTGYRSQQAPPVPLFSPWLCPCDLRLLYGLQVHGSDLFRQRKPQLLVHLPDGLPCPRRRIHDPQRDSRPLNGRRCQTDRPHLTILFNLL